MPIAKRCFICAHKQNPDGRCSNPECPRSKEYLEHQEQAGADKSTTANA